MWMRASKTYIDVLKLGLNIGSCAPRRLLETYIHLSPGQCSAPLFWLEETRFDFSYKRPVFSKGCHKLPTCRSSIIFGEFLIVAQRRPDTPASKASVYVRSGQKSHLKWYRLVYFQSQDE